MQNMILDTRHSILDSSHRPLSRSPPPYQTWSILYVIPLLLLHLRSFGKKLGYSSAGQLDADLDHTSYISSSSSAF